MIGELTTRADRYFRSRKTKFARAIDKASPKTGEAYRTSRRKKIIERIIAAPPAILSLPVVGVTAAAIKLEDGGPVVFRHERIGKDGELFKLKKLRSLDVDANRDPDANKTNAENLGMRPDPRSTRVGRVIRKYHIDELPQLWQVETGEVVVFGMRAEDDVAREVMEKARPDDAKDLQIAYEIEPPALTNLVYILADRNPSNESASTIQNRKYHIHMLWARKASLGFGLYVGFRYLANGILEKEKMKNKQKK